jgi:hypothetical protein
MKLEFDWNVHMHEGFDYDDVHLESWNLVEDFGLVIGLISTPSGPFASKSIIMPSKLNKEA